MHIMLNIMPCQNDSCCHIPVHLSPTLGSDIAEPVSAQRLSPEISILTYTTYRHHAPCRFIYHRAVIQVSGQIAQKTLHSWPACP